MPRVSLSARHRCRRAPPSLPHRRLRPTPEPCLVRASVTGVVVHVGPGENRNPRTTLRINQDYAVRGSALDNRGNLWFNIVRPNFSDPDLDRWWVAAADVQTTGGCDQVAAIPTSVIVLQQIHPTAGPTLTGAPDATAAADSTPGGALDCTLIGPYAPPSIVNAGGIGFSWSPVPGAAAYRLVISNDATKQIIFITGLVSSTNAQVDGSGWGGKVDWVVQALPQTLDENAKCESASFSFTVIPKGP